MRILVTGGAGLIGSNLCKSLLLDEHHVFCVDNFTSGTFNNIESYIDNDRFTLLNLNTVDKIPDFKIDQIYNLASPTAPGHFKADPISTITSNIIGTINLLKEAHIQNIKVVHVSSIRTMERNDTFNDNACYIESKRCSETICYEYRKLGVDVKVARLFNVYGSNMVSDDSRVIPHFIRTALNGNDITIFGDGSQMDSFCYVDDIVEGLKTLMNLDISVVNLGSKEFISIFDLANLIIKITNSRSKVVMIKNTEKCNTREKITINHIDGWEPSISLSTGLNKYIESMKKIQ